MGMILSWLVLSLAVWVASGVLPGFKVKGKTGVFLVAALLGLLNWALGMVFFVLIGIGTLGIGFLFAFVTRWAVDAILLKIVDALTEQLEIKGFRWALGGALVISGVGTLAEFVLRRAGC